MVTVCDSPQQKLSTNCIMNQRDMMSLQGDCHFPSFMVYVIIRFFSLFSPSSLRSGVSEGDLAWVGAWWGGIIIGAILIFIFGITLFFFPKQILSKDKGSKKNSPQPEEEEEEEEDEEDEDDEDGGATEARDKRETGNSLVMTNNQEDKMADDSACYRLVDE